MNSVILIGNGFDLAHGLKTSYRDFIDDFWEKEKQKVISCLDRKLTEKYYYYSYDDEFISMISPCAINDIPHSLKPYEKGYNWFSNLASSKYTINIYGHNIGFKVKYKNIFLQLITEKYYFQNWADIEAVYYFSLNQCLKNKWPGGIIKLNHEFSAIRQALEAYLAVQMCNDINVSQRIKEIFNSMLQYFLINKTLSKQNNERILFLNFNYTNTIRSYINILTECNIGVKYINIHGEINNKNNPIIFGYGDETDENYKIIKNKYNNDYLENIKSYKYPETDNYKNMLSFINFDAYEIYNIRALLRNFGQNFA